MEKRTPQKIDRQSQLRQELLKPKVRYTEGLPILEKKDAILDALRTHQVIIIAGETGSGKTTQLPLICIEAGRGTFGKIGCTQPRRIAAISIANRVCQELGCTMGQEVGYKIRFSDKDAPNTCIKFMTDGILLAELESDPYLSIYDTLIIDEAHERSLNIDFILGYLRTLLIKRPDLKVLISSATIDTTLFSKAFNNAPVIEVSGRMFPVEVLYLAHDEENEDELSYVDSAVRAAEDMLDLYPDGDMLIFMPTERDIRESLNKLRGKKRPNTVVLPLFSRLTRQEQESIFNEIPQRKVVVATNIAETSITVPNIKFVIDTGLARISRYVPRLRTSRLPIEPIAQAAANQRMGRCGRVMDGVCVRLFSAREFATRDPFTTPEIRRSNLAGVILSMIAHNLGEIESFAFLEPPAAVAISEGYTLLRELGALDQSNRLTRLGWQMSRLPLDPHIARMVIAGQTENALHEVTIIAAALSIVDPRERPFEKQAEADLMHKRFTVPGSDFLSFVKLWDTYAEEWHTLKTQSKMRKFCKEHFLSFSRMQEWHDVYAQIGEAVNRLKGFVKNSTPASFDAVHRSMLTGLLSNCAHKNEQGKYRATRGRELYIFPGSSLYGQKPDWIVCHEIIETSQCFAHTASPINPAWLEELAPHLCTRNYSEPWFDPESGIVVATERVSFFGLQIAEHPKKAFFKINPQRATETFIRQALVEEGLEQQLKFYLNNKKVRTDIETLEAKLRTRSLFAGDNALFDFYAARIPAAGSIHELNKLIKEKNGDDFLFLRQEDLLAAEIPESASFFPDSLSIGARSFPVKYAFAPGSEHDGVTLRVKRNETSFITEKALGYLVPALWPVKITELLRALPKETRKKLLPIEATAKALASELVISSESFEQNLCRILLRKFNIDLDRSTFTAIRLPDHLSMRVEVTDPLGATITTGRGIAPLKLSDAKHPIPDAEWSSAFVNHEKCRITSWDFGDVTEFITVPSPKGGIPLYGYPALVDCGTSVDLKYFPAPETAAAFHRQGVKRLTEHLLSTDFAWIERDFRLSPVHKLHCSPFGGSDRVRSSVLMSIKNRLLSIGADVPVTKEGFDIHMTALRSIAKTIGTEACGVLDKSFMHLQENRIRIAKITLPRLSALKKELAADLDRYFSQINDSLSYLFFVQYPRYLKAFSHRIDRAVNEPIKYAKNRLQIAHYERKLAALPISKLPEPVQLEIDSFKRMIEEFAISLFAQQEVKTLYPVSEQRLDKKLGEVDQLISNSKQ